MSTTASSALSVRTGTSRSRDVVQAADDLFKALDQPEIKLAVFYCAADYDLPALARAMHERFGDINLIGCTTAGEITPIGYLDGTITGFSLASDDLEIVTRCLPIDPFEPSVGDDAVGAMLEELAAKANITPCAENAFAFLLIDGLAGQEELVVSTIHQRLHGIDLIGGSAADDVRFGAAHLYWGGQFHRNVALITLAHTNLPFLAFRTQHFVHSAKRMVVTRADAARRIVYEINGRPAAHEFARLVGVPITELTPMVFGTYPVMVRIGGQYFVRSIGKVNEDESLQFFCAIDEGIVLTIAEGVDLVSNLRDAFDQVREAIGPPQLVLGCDCVLRRLECDREDLRAEVGQIFAENNVVGFATYGEQFNSMHVNQTFTGIAIGRAV